MNITKESILTALVSLILGYRDKYAPSSEGEALTKLQSMIPGDGSLLTLELAMNKMLGAIGLNLGKIETVSQLLDAAQEVYNKASRNVDPVSDKLDTIIDRIKKLEDRDDSLDPLDPLAPYRPNHPFTPRPQPYQPWINPYPYIVPYGPTSTPYNPYTTPDIICKDSTTAKDQCPDKTQIG